MAWLMFLLPSISLQELEICGNAVLPNQEHDVLAEIPIALNGGKEVHDLDKTSACRDKTTVNSNGMAHIYMSIISQVT